MAAEEVAETIEKAGGKRKLATAYAARRRGEAQVVKPPKPVIRWSSAVAEQLTTLMAGSRLVLDAEVIAATTDRVELRVDGVAEPKDNQF